MYQKTLNVSLFIALLLLTMTGNALEYESPKEISQDINDIETQYYIRIMAIDKPGVFSSIAGILGRNLISISSVMQKVHKKGAAVPVVLVTHEAKERNIRRALKTINSLPIIKGKCVAIRIEKDL